MAAGGGRQYALFLSRPARKALDSLPRQVQERISPAIDALADDPRPHGSVKLAGNESRYRIRVGDYRVIYAIADDRLIVLVLAVGHRREVYRDDD